IFVLTRFQTMQHFLFFCLLVQCLGQDFWSLFSFPHAVSLQQAVFSWSPQAQVLGWRYGFCLQARHMVAVHSPHLGCALPLSWQFMHFYVPCCYVIWKPFG